MMKKLLTKLLSLFGWTWADVFAFLMKVLMRMLGTTWSVVLGTVEEAEERFDTGAEKFQYVWDRLSPYFLDQGLPKRLIRWIIETAVSIIKGVPEA